MSARYRFTLRMSDKESAGFLKMTPVDPSDGLSHDASSNVSNHASNHASDNGNSQTIKLDPRLALLLVVLIEARKADEDDEECDPIAVGWRSRQQVGEAFAAAREFGYPIAVETVSAYACQIKRELKGAFPTGADVPVLLETRPRLGIRLAPGAQIDRLPPPGSVGRPRVGPRPALDGRRVRAQNGGS